LQVTCEQPEELKTRRRRLFPALDRSCDVCLWQILLQKSAVIDGWFGHFATGFDAPALTFSKKLERYTIHRS